MPDRILTVAAFAIVFAVILGSDADRWWPGGGERIAYLAQVGDAP